jgi:hypothetical protein
MNQGVMVLRFSNRDIWERFEGVKIQIDEEVKKRWNPPTTASRSPAPQGADKDRQADGERYRPRGRTKIDASAALGKAGTFAGGLDAGVFRVEIKKSAPFGGGE